LHNEGKGSKRKEEEKYICGAYQDSTAKDHVCIIEKCSKEKTGDQRTKRKGQN